MPATPSGHTPRLPPGNLRRRNQEALPRFCAEARLEGNNKRVENCLGPVALGRKDYLLAGSDGGSERAAASYTPFQSARLNFFEINEDQPVCLVTGYRGLPVASCWMG